MAQIFQEIISDGLIVAQVLQLLLEAGSAVHGSRWIFGFARRLDLTESQAAALLIGAEPNEVSTWQAGAAFPFIATVRPRKVT